MSKRALTDAEISALVICYYMAEDGRGFANLTKAGLVKAGNFLLRRGYVIRGEFVNNVTREKSYGFKITDDGIDAADEIDTIDWCRCGNAVGFDLKPNNEAVQS